MRINRDFILSDIGDEYILVPVGETALQFNQVVTFNEIDAFLWEHLDEDVSMTDLIFTVMEEYEVSRKVVEKDIETFFNRLTKLGIIEFDQEDGHDSDEA